MTPARPKPRQTCSCQTVFNLKGFAEPEGYIQLHSIKLAATAE